MHAYYYSTVTMTTVGYGDITATTDLEVLLNIFTMFVACGVFAYSFNEIG